MGPMLTIFAHPDDETFGAAGVMAAAVERGVPVTVISATRGEAGESAVPGLDDPERLGVVVNESCARRCVRSTYRTCAFSAIVTRGWQAPLPPSIHGHSFAYPSRPRPRGSYRTYDRFARM